MAAFDLTVVKPESESFEPQWQRACRNRFEYLILKAGQGRAGKRRPAFHSLGLRHPVSLELERKPGTEMHLAGLVSLRCKIPQSSPIRLRGFGWIRTSQLRFT